MAIAFVLNSLAVLSALLSGTLGHSALLQCNLTLHHDYVFFLQCIASALFLALLPRYFSVVESCVEEVRVLDRNDDGKQPSNPWDGIQRSKTIFAVIMFAVVLLLLGIIYLTVDGISQNTDNGELPLWWWPSWTTLPAAMFFWAFSIGIVSVSVWVMSYYVSAMLAIRHGVARTASTDVRWLIAPGGPVRTMLTSLTFLIAPFASVPIGIVISRTTENLTALSDPVSVLLMLTIPTAVLLLVILPMYLTGICARVGNRRRTLLGKNSEQMSEVFHKLYTMPTGDNREKLLSQMDILSKEQQFIYQHYSMWPFTVSEGILAATISSIPAVVTIVVEIT